MPPATPQREYPPAPVAGVGGVVLSGGRVLLVRRGQPPMQGQWSIPGGAVELGETLHQAVVREVEEETGLRVVPAAFLTTFDRIARDADGRVQYHYILIDFLCHPADAAAPLVPGSDALEAEWASVEGLRDATLYALPDWTLRVIEQAAVMARTLPAFDLRRAGHSA